MRSWKTIVLLAAMLALLVWMYGVRGNAEEVAVRGHSAVMWMVSRWGGAGGGMSHCWIIPLVSAFVVWWKRRELAAAPKAFCAFGLAVVAGALVLHWLGVRVQQTRVSLFALIALLWGIPLYLYGRHTARLLLFPCAYLVFCIPMSFLDEMTLPLRLFSSSAATALVGGLGIPVTRAGTLITLMSSSGPVRLGVEDPCSGLRSLLAIAAIAAAYAFFTQAKPWKGWLLFLSALPLAVAGNVLRITTVALVGKALGAERALAFYEEYSGYIVFVAAVLLMMGVGRLLDIDWRKRVMGFNAKEEDSHKEAQEAQSIHEDASAFASAFGLLRSFRSFAANLNFAAIAMDAARQKRCVVVIGLMAATALPLTFQGDVRTDDAFPLKLELPASVGNYQGADRLFCQNAQCETATVSVPDDGRTVCPKCGGALGAVSVGERTGLPADTEIRKRRYTSPAGDTISVWIVVSGKDQKSIHRPQQCLPAQGLTIERRRIVRMPMDAQSPLGVTLLDLRRRGGRGDDSAFQSFAYWFVGPDRETPSNLARLFWLSYDRVIRGVNRRWAYVAVATGREQDSDAHVERIQSFVADLHPQITSQHR